jgi:hypothetical protein
MVLCQADRDGSVSACERWFYDRVIEMVLCQPERDGSVSG